MFFLYILQYNTCIGSGNWGSAIAKIIGMNCSRYPCMDDTVNMYVHQETITLNDGTTRELTDVINEQHENVKYLPGIKLPDNVVAVPDLSTACQDATLLIFVTPHQFLPSMLPTIRQSVAPHCRGVHLIKGIGKGSIICFVVSVQIAARIHFLT